MGVRITVVNNPSNGTGGYSNPLGDVICDPNGLGIYVYPNDGYKVASVIRSSNNSQVPRFNNDPGIYHYTNPVTNEIITVTFTRITYNVTVNSGGNGITGLSSVANTVNSGANLTFTPIPSAGYQVSTVTNATNNNNGSYTVSNVTTNKTIQVNFTRTTYNVTVNPGGNGAVSVQPSNSVISGASLPFTTIPATGYKVDTVTRDGVTVTASAENSYIISSVNSDTTVAVTFTRITHNVTVNYGQNGSTASSSVVTAVNEGASLDFTPSPSAGYRVLSVRNTTNSVDILPNSNGDSSYTVSNVTTAKTIDVTFIQIFTVTVNPDANGRTNKDGSNNSVDINGNLTITTQPSTGYKVDTVTRDGATVTASAENSYTISNVISDVTVAVTFTRIICVVTVNSDANGSSSLQSVSNNVSYGDSLTFTPSPSEGYRLLSVTNATTNANPNPSAPGSYIVSNVISNVTVQVTFIQIFTVTVTTPNVAIGETDKTGTNTVDIHGSLIITPSAAPGYRVYKLINNGVVVSSYTGGSYTVANVNANVTVEFTFKQIFTVTVFARINTGAAAQQGSPYTVDINDSLTITPTQPTGYRIASVANATNNNNGTCTVSNVINNVIVDVTFTKITYLVTVICGANGTTNKTGDNGVLYDNNLSITATAATGYRLYKIIKNGITATDAETIASYNVSNVNANITVEFTFKKIYIVTVNTGLNGITDKTGSNNKVDIDGSLIITPTPSTGYKVSSVTNATNNNNGTYTVSNVINDVIVNVTFTKITYLVTVICGANGTANGNTGPNTTTTGVLYNDPLTITYAPATGYRIYKIIKNGITATDAETLASLYTVSNVNANVTVEFIFKQIFTVTVTTPINGTTDKTDANTVDINGSLIITPAPAAGYRVDTVTKDDGVNAAVNVPSNGNDTYTIANVTSNITVAVTFTKITYIVTVTSDANGATGLSSVSNDVLYNESLQFTPIPNTGYQILNVTKDGIDLAADANGLYTIANVSSNIKVIVTFTRITYIVTVPAVSNGSTGLSSVSNNVLYNDSLIITPAPTTGYKVSNVTKVNGTNVPVDVPANAGGRTYTIANVSSDLTINITFTLITYQVTVICGANGRANGTTGLNTTTNNVLYGENLDITYAPATGYRVDRIIKNGTNVTSNTLLYTGGSYTVANVNANVTVELTFKKIYTVTVNTLGGNGTTDKTGSNNKVDINGSLTITPAPATGYRVLNVTNAYDNGNQTYTVSNVTSDITVDVTFIEFFTVTVTSGANGSTDKNGNNNKVDINGYLFVTPMPQAGYKVDKFQIDGILISKILNKPPFKISNVTSNLTVHVTFSPIIYEVSVVCGENGITDKTGITNKFSGESLTFRPTANTGYRLFNVTNATENGDGTYTVANITSNKTVNVTFLENYTVTIVCGENGTTDATGITNKFYGESLIFTPTPTPNSNYRIGKVTNAINNGNGTYTVANITSNKTVNVTFV
jgi:urease gamma subunit